jgi:DNA-binding NarL/FixJ family response regulator
MNRPRVLMADDHRMVAEGLKRLLDPEFELVGVVEDGLALIEAAKKLHPDIIIADITMPGLNGLEAIAQIKKECPRIKVVTLTMHREVAYARRALDAGASAFVLKHSAPEELLTAIRAALAGKTYITPAVAGELLQEIKEDPEATRDPLTALTPRQREVLQLFAGGRSAKEVASMLSISARTAEFHKYKLMETLGLQNNSELTRFAIKHGIVSA